MRKFIILFLLLVFLFPIGVKADETVQDDSNASYSGEVENLYRYIDDIKDNYTLIKNMDIRTYVKDFISTGNGKATFKTVSKGILGFIFKEMTENLKLMISLIVISIICSLLTNLESAFSNNSISNIAYYACYSLIIIIIVKGFYIDAKYARETIYNLTNFMAALMPVLIVLLSSVGGITEAAFMDPVILSVINLDARIFVDFIIPIIFIGFVLQFVNNLSENYKISKLIGIVNKSSVIIQGAVMTIFIGIITIRGITSKTMDQVAAKTAKFAVDNFVPVVGKCLSDAVSTVAGYSLLLKNAVSFLGLIVVIAIVISPIIKIFVMAFMYKLTAALIEPISDKRIVDSISGAGDSLILINSTLICISIMFFIMISIVAAAGKMAVGG